MFTIQDNQITFVDGRFYGDGEGNYFPSVTTVLEAYPKSPEYYQWLKEVGDNADTIRDDAGRRGSVVHALTEQYDKWQEVQLIGANGTPLYSLKEWAMFERYVDFTTRFNPEHIKIEETIVSQAIGVGGTIDRVSVINGKRFLIDIKTSKGIYNHYWLQLAAYREMLNEPVDAVAILWLNAKTRTVKENQGIGWQLVSIEDTTHDLNLFRATHALWLEENKNAKPKNFSYNLKHKKNVKTKETSNI